MAFTDSGGGGGYSSMEGLYGIYSGGDTAARSKRVMVVVDETSRSKHAMMWALTHLTNKGDLMTLLHVVSPHDEPSPSLAQSLGSLCKACKPEVPLLFTLKNTSNNLHFGSSCCFYFLF